MPAILGPGEGFFSPNTLAASAPGFTPAPVPPPAPKQNNNGVVQNAQIPGASAYASAALTAKTAYQKALAQINEQRSDALRQYGYLGDIDPTTGTLTNMRVDPNNPYGLYQQMLSGAATAQDQVKAAAAARGLGHGGLAAQGLTAAHHTFGADSMQLGQNLMSQLEGLQGQQNDSETAMNDALYQAELDQARNAIAAGNFSTPDYSGVTVPDYGSPTAPPASIPPTAPKAPAAPRKPVFTAATKPTAVKVTANKTGASRNKRQGIFSIH